MSSVTERFLNYAVYDTRSDEKAGVVPSSPGQMELALEVEKEMTELGMVDISVDEHAYVMGTLPANTDREGVPSIGLIAHLDTSSEISGATRPRIIENYDGGDILLNEEEKVIFSPADFPDLADYKGEDLIVTDGIALLGADDKAGMAISMAAVEYLVQHPEIKHGPVKVCFTPDEEIGHQARFLDLKKFGADFAYTIDGGPLGDLNYETFNAAKAEITIKGRNIHPGRAKDKMVNSVLIGNELVSMFPADETPATTENREGFYHILSFTGDVEKTELVYIIRDHDMDIFQKRKAFMSEMVSKLQEKYGKDVVDLKMEDQYYNMADKIADSMHIVNTAVKAMESLGIKPDIAPIRGGTDGSSLSQRGLLTPNIFTGGNNFHGRFEFVPIFALEKGVDVVVKIIEMYGSGGQN
jgi:tripeptide aminopeptidase